MNCRADSPRLRLRGAAFFKAFANPGTPRFHLFSGILPEIEEQILAGLPLKILDAGDCLLREGQENEEVFLVESGELAAWKGDPNSSTATQIAVLTPGDCIGEMSALNGAPVSATLIALTPATLHVLHFGRIENALVREIMTQNVVRTLGSRLTEAGRGMRERHEELVRTLKVQSAAAIFAMRTLLVMSFYTVCLPIYEKVKELLPTPALFSFFIIMLFTGVSWNFLVHSSTGLADYGFKWTNWRDQIWRGVSVTLPLVALVTLAKAGAAWAWPDQYALFEPARTIDDGVFHIGSWLFHTGAYIVLTFAQEIVRCAMQGSLAIFYRSSRTPDRWRSLLAANVAFAATHVHLGLIFPVLALVPGFFWGWLYQRENSYLSVVASHVLLGGWVLFVLGVPY